MPTAGIHIITTTFGNWLPGDDRGHWSPLFDMYGRLIDHGCKLNLPDKITLHRAESLMTQPPKTLDIAEQILIGSVISGLVAPPYTPAFSRGSLPPTVITSANAGAKYPLPTCHACAIEDNHAHFLFGPIAEPLDRFVGRLKGMSASTLLKLPCNHGRNSIWTTRFWKVFLYDPDGVRAVQKYIEQHNIRRGLDAQRFPFVQPI